MVYVSGKCNRCVNSDTDYVVNQGRSVCLSFLLNHASISWWGQMNILWESGWIRWIRWLNAWHFNILAILVGHWSGGKSSGFIVQESSSSQKSENPAPCVDVEERLWAEMHQRHRNSRSTSLWRIDLGMKQTLVTSNVLLSAEKSRLFWIVTVWLTPVSLFNIYTLIYTLCASWFLRRGLAEATIARRCSNFLCPGDRRTVLLCVMCFFRSI